MVATVFVPGYGNSLNGHWQENWYAETQNAYWVNQKDWNTPICTEWVETLNDLVQTIKDPILFITHSLGRSTVIEWAHRYSAPIIGLFAVAIPDVMSVRLPKEILGYNNPPLTKLPFPSVAIASTDDQYSTIEKSTYYADNWGSLLITIGAAGHINRDSGFGSWSEGKELLHSFLHQLPERNL